MRQIMWLEDYIVMDSNSKTCRWRYPFDMKSLASKNMRTKTRFWTMGKRSLSTRSRARLYFVFYSFYTSIYSAGNHSWRIISFAGVIMSILVSALYNRSCNYIGSTKSDLITAWTKNSMSCNDIPPWSRTTECHPVDSLSRCEVARNRHRAVCSASLLWMTLFSSIKKLGNLQLNAICSNTSTFRPTMSGRISLSLQTIDIIDSCLQHYRVFALLETKGIVWHPRQKRS